MRHSSGNVSRRLFLAGASAVATDAWAEGPSSSLPPVAITDVNVVSMVGREALRRQTVLVAEGRFRAIGTEPPPSHAIRVSGEGRLWLSPGLADMHNHVDSREDLAVQLANGVTSMLNMGEAKNSFVGRTRAAVARGDVPGPQVFAALAVDGSPQYGHLVVATREDALAAVRVAKANGYEFIKVYNNLPAEAFAALLEATRAAGLSIVGHGVTSVGLARQLAAGQALVAHAEEFFYTVFSQPPATDPTRAPALDEIPAAVELAKRSGAFVVADLVTYGAIAEQWGRPEVVKAYLRRPETAYLSPDMHLAWPAAGYARRSGDLKPRLRFLEAFVSAMSEAGVPLLSGTDCPDIPGLVPGFALHGNLAALTAAGLSPYAALSTATRTAGEFIGRTRPGSPLFGVVQVGARADAVLFAANPLEDLSTLRTPLGVLAGGRWYDAGRLQAMLTGVRNSYKQAAKSILAAPDR